MNILPKKSWHVRTRDNIARVKRDEARAAEEEKEKEGRIATAEQEARTEVLRAKARGNISGSSSYVPQTTRLSQDEGLSEASAPQALPRTHINFFSEIEAGSNTKTTNKDHAAEKKQEQDAYEKKIGLLVGLGQSSIESLTVKPWYQQSRAQQEQNKTESIDTDTNDLKRKSSMDPMNDMMRYLGKKPKSGADAEKTGNRTHLSGDKKSQPTGGLPGTKSLLTMFSKYKSKSKEENSKETDTHHSRHKEKKKKRLKLKKSRSSRDSKHRKRTSDGKNSRHRSKSKHRHRQDSVNTDSDSDRDSRQEKSRRRERKHRRKSRHSRHSYSESDSESTASSKSEDSDGQAEPKSSAPTIEQMRAERLRREAAERTKTVRLLSGKPLEDKPPAETKITDKLDGKYNSQFNPHLARKRQPKEPLF